MQTKRINILHIDYDDLSNSYGAGGQAVVTRELYRHLQRDFTVTVLTGNYPGAENNKVIDGILYKRMGIGSMGSTISLLSFLTLIPFAIWRMQNNYDLIIEFFTAPFSSSPGFLAVKKPYLAVQTFFGAKELSKKYHLPIYLLENLTLKKIKNFLVPTVNIKEKIEQINPSAHIAILPYGFDNSLLKVKTLEKKYILFMGRIDLYNKGIDLLLRSWVVIANKHPELKLYIMGSGKPNDQKKLKVLIHKLHVEKSILLLGRQIGQKKVDYLANCLFAVIPSRFETFCISALEILAVGKPLVISNIEGMSWIPNNCVLRFNSGGQESIINACNQLIINKDKRRNLASAGKKFAASFTWEEIVKNYKKTINNFMLL